MADMARRLELILGGPARPFPLTVEDADQLVSALDHYIVLMRETNAKLPIEDERDAEYDREHIAALMLLRGRLREHSGFNRR